MRYSFSLLSLIIALLVLSCSEQDNKSGKFFRIDGIIKSVPDGTKVFLQTDDELSMKTLMETETLNGRFRFEGRQDSCIECFVTYETDGMKMGAIFFLENGNIKMDLTDSSKITGTSNNNTYQAFLNKINTIYGQVGELVMEGDSLKQSEAMSRHGKDALALINTTIENNYQNPVGFYLLRRFSNHMDFKMLDHHINSLPPSYRKSPLLEELKTQMSIMSEDINPEMDSYDIDE